MSSPSRKYKPKHKPRGLWLAFTLESLCIPIAFVMALFWTYTRPGGYLPFLPYAVHVLVLFAMWLVSVREVGLWEPAHWWDFATYFKAVVWAVSRGIICSVGIMYFFQGNSIASEFLLAYALIALVLMLAVRILIQAITPVAHRVGLGRRRLLVVSDAPLPREKLEQLDRRHDYLLVGTLCDKPLDDMCIVPRLGRVAEIQTVLDRYTPDEVLLTISPASQYDLVESVVQACEQRHVTVHVKADLFQLRCAKNKPMYIDDTPLLSLSAVPEDQLKLAAKRALDFLGATALILLLSPCFLLVALIIKLESRGPVFFLQERVGRNQRRFRMIKFRSMVANAEALRKQLEDENELEGPVFKVAHDPRITRFGHFIRKHSIDEFPQLFNVWKGEMSLVGPRPPLPSEVEDYSWDQRRRLSVRPGMTGLWQVSGRADLHNFQEWVDLDLKYIDTWTLLLDIKILFKTFHEVYAGRGAA